MADSDKFYNIHLVTDADGKGVDQIIAKWQQLRAARQQMQAEDNAAAARDRENEELQKLALQDSIDQHFKLTGALQQQAEVERETAEAGNEIGEALKIGLSVDLVHRFTEALEEVPAKIKEAIHLGLEFNESSEGTMIAVRAAFLAASNGALTLEQAEEAANEEMAKLREGAQVAAVPIEALYRIYTRTVDIAKSQNIPLRQWTDLLNEAALAGSNMHLSMDEVEMSLRYLMEGIASRRNIFTQNLGIDQKSLALAKEAGLTIDYLHEKIAAFQQPINSEEGALTRLENALNKALGAATKQLFDSIKQSAGELAEKIEQMDTKPFEELAQDLGELVKIGERCVEWAIDNKEKLIFLAKAAFDLGIVLAGIKIGEFVGWLAKQAFSIGQNVAALAAENGLLPANTLLWAENAAARAAASGAGAAQAGESALAGGVTAYGAQKAMRAVRIRAAGTDAMAAEGESILAGGAEAGGAMGIAAIGEAAAMVLVPLGALYLLMQGVDAEYEKENAAMVAADEPNRKILDGIRQRIAAAKSEDEMTAIRGDTVRELRYAQDEAHAAYAAGDDEEATRQANQIGRLRTLLDVIDNHGTKLIEQNALEAENNRLQQEKNAALLQQTQLRNALDKAAPKVSEELEKIKVENMTPEEKLADAQAKLATATHGMGMEKYTAFLAGMQPEDGSAGAKKELEEEVNQFLLTAEQAQRELEQAQKAVDAKNKADDEANTRSEEETNRQTEKINKQQESLLISMIELQISEAKAKGDEKTAALLEHELKVRELMKKLMADTALSEQQAAQFAERKVTADEKAAKIKTADKAEEKAIGKGEHLGKAHGAHGDPGGINASGFSVSGIDINHNHTRPAPDPWQRAQWDADTRRLNATATASAALPTDKAGADVASQVKTGTTAQVAALDKIGTALKDRDEKILQKLKDLEGIVLEARN